MTNDNMLDNDMLNSDLYSTTQKCIVTIPKILRTMSILSSTFVAHGVLKLSERRANTTNFLLLVLSICYIIFSFVGSILGRWLIPRGLTYESAGN